MDNLDQNKSPEAFAKILAKNLAPGVLAAFVENQSYESYAEKPIEFCERYLDETYTDDVKELMLSVRDNTITVARSGNAVGKSQPLKTKVMVPAGEKNIGDTNPGDYVMGKSGKPCKIKAVHPQGLQPTYKISFNDETFVLASEDHLWSARSSSMQHRGKPYKIYTTKELINKISAYMHIPMCGSVEYNTKILKVDPYVMGVLIGDGTLGQQVRFDSEDEWIIEEFKKRISNANVKRYKNKKTHHGITTAPGKKNPVLEAVKEYGLIGCGAKEKHIPHDYLFGDVGQRKLLLAGLLDTDGYIDTRHSMSFCTISPVLAKQTQKLIWSLGGTAKIRVKQPVYTHKGEKRIGQDAYNLYIKLPFCPFRLPRKVDRYTPEENLQKQAQRVIKAIEYVGQMESVCIEVDNEDGLYLTENFIVTHNSHAAARVAVWFMLTRSGVQVYTAAAPPEDNLKRILWGEINSIIQKKAKLFSDCNFRSLNIEKSATEFITGVTIPTSGTASQREAKFSGKHAPYLLFILDEGDAIPDEVYQGIESCMSGGIQVRLLIMFNPRSQTGAPYRFERDGKANIVELTAFSHPNVITGKNIIPGAVTCDVTVRRIVEWCRPLADDEQITNDCFELPKFLEDVSTKLSNGFESEPLKAGHYKVVEPAFSYMVLGKYPAQSTNQLISREWIQAARLRYDVYTQENKGKPPEGVQPTMGFDIAEGVTEGDNNAACFRYAGYVAPLHTWGGMDLLETEQKGIELYRNYHAKICIVDGTGVGAGVAPHMVRHNCFAVSLKFASKGTERTEIGDFLIIRDQLWWMCREWLRTDSSSMLPPNEKLVEQLATPTYKVENGKIRVMKKDIMRELLGYSPDEAESLILTWGDTLKASKPQRGVPQVVIERSKKKALIMKV